MENATKALIIAASIIIAIILISLGVFVVNQGKSAIGNINLSEQEIAAFNSKWESYQGNQVGSSIRSLITQVNNYNRTVNDDRYIAIAIGTQDAPSDTEEFIAEINYNLKPSSVGAGTACKVTFSYSKSGLISHIYVNGTGVNDGKNY